MPQEEKAADVARREEGYTLYDLVSMADSAELDRLDDETLLRTSPTSCRSFSRASTWTPSGKSCAAFPPSRFRR